MLLHQSVLRGLRRLHAIGVPHGDLKAANVSRKERSVRGGKEQERKGKTTTTTTRRRRRSRRSSSSSSSRSSSSVFSTFVLQVLYASGRFCLTDLPALNWSGNYPSLALMRPDGLTATPVLTKDPVAQTMVRFIYTDAHCLHRLAAIITTITFIVVVVIIIFLFFFTIILISTITTTTTISFT